MTIRLWDPGRAEEVSQFRVRNGLACLAFFPKGHMLASSDWLGGMIRLPEASIGKRVWSKASEDPLISSKVFFPDGPFSDPVRLSPAFQVWPVATGRELTNGGQGRQAQLAFSLDGALLVCSGEKKIVFIWDWSRAKEVRDLMGRKRRSSPVAFSPDGNLIAWGELEGVRLWQVATGKEVQTLRGDHRPVSRVVFSPDGRYLVSLWSWDRAVHLWEVATGEEVHRFEGHQDGVGTAAFSPDGRRLASGSGDSTIIIWDIAAPLNAGQGPRDVEQSWGALAGGDAREAFRAIWELARVPDRTLPFLRKRLQPVPSVPSRQVDGLIADLGSDEYAVRVQATEKLKELAEVAGPELGKVLLGRPSLEVRRRVEELVKRLKQPVPPPEQLRGLRAVGVLEYIGTPGAQQVLQTLAAGAPEARLTQEAKASLDRLARRTASRP